MKNFLKLILTVCIIVTATRVNAFTVRQAVILNTDIKTSEQLLVDTVNLYSTKLQLVNIDKDRHLYTVKYTPGRCFPTPAGTVITDVGGFSCTFKSLNKMDTLVTCRKISMSGDYIYNHYEKFFRELKLNGIKYIPYKKYLKLNQDNI